MRSAFLLAATFLSLLNPPLHAQSSVESPRCPPDLPPSDTRIGIRDSVDLPNPKYLVSLTELADKPHRIVEFSGHPAANQPTERVHYEIDKDSKLSITFNRPLFLKNDAEADLMIRGRVISGSSEHAIEIPGYSLIGEKTQVSSAHIHSPSEFRTIIYQFQETACQLRSDLDALRRLTESLTSKADSLRALEDTLRNRQAVAADADDAIGKAMAQVERLQDSTQVLQTRLDSLLAGKREDSARVRGDSSTLADYLVITQNKLESAQNQLDTADETYSRQQMEVSRTWQRLQDLRQESEVAQQLLSGYVPSARRHLMLQWPFLDEALTSLVNPADSTFLRVLGSHTRRMPRGIAREVDLIRQYYSQLTNNSGVSPDSSQLVVWRDAIENIYTIMSRLAAHTSPRDLNSDAIRSDLVGSLKDTDFLVSSTGAKPGDRIVLTITNNTEQGGLPRTLQVTLPVTQYGLIQNLSDAFLLVNRLGVNARENRAVLTNARSLALSAASDTSNAKTYTQEVDQPNEIRYEPTPSFTYGWVYNNRPCHGICGPLEKLGNLVHWLQPGFGLNVAFPRFENTVIRVVGDPNTKKVSEDTVVYKRNVNLAIGGVATFFKNAVVVGYGRSITSDSPHRNYFGIGFSFVQVVEGVLKAIKVGS